MTLGELSSLDCTDRMPIYAPILALILLVYLFVYLPHTHARIDRTFGSFVCCRIECPT